MTPHPSNPSPQRQQRYNPRGFTLIEVTLALVLSALVLAGVLGVFLAMNNVEKTFAARYERTNELDITHTGLSRAMLNLQMQEADTTQVVRADDQTLSDAGDEPEPRDRLILETDNSVEPDSTGWVPQRLEVVCATPPIPAALATREATWYRADDNADSLDFSAMDGSQGVTRGVFELRPSGQRERLMQRLGLINPSDPILEELDTNQQITTDLPPEPDWTLWWRPILSNESDMLVQGLGPYPDSFGEPEEIRARLAGAVPLLRHIERCLWEFYKGDEYIDTHYGLTMSDLPAYAQFEVILTNSQYASWMFEIDWVIGDDPADLEDTSNDALANSQDPAQNDQPPGPGNNNDGTGSGRRPGGQIDPNSTRTFNLSGDS